MMDGSSAAERGPGTATRAGSHERRPVRSLSHRPAGTPRLPVEGRLPPFAGAVEWLNSPPLTPEALRGRVVLVDFCTYTCVNWLRTLPHVRAWAGKYADAGLTVVGVHTPEFGFEGDVANVAAQTRALGVEHPVAVDSRYAIWSAFSNRYWPALYVADAEGRIRYHHFGEGEYAMAEMVVQQLLLDAGAEHVDQDLVAVEPRGLEVAADWATLRSPENYLGYARTVGFASAVDADFDRPHRYTAAPRLSLNHWDLSGTWTVGEHSAVLDAPGGRIVFEFQARDVNLVMGPAPGGGPVPFRVVLGTGPDAGASGTDVGADGRGTVTDPRCYQLVRRSGPITQRRVEIEFLAAGVEVHCVTFG